MPFVHRVHLVKHDSLKKKKKGQNVFCPIFSSSTLFSIFRSRIYIYIVYSNTRNGCDLVLFIVQYWKKCKGKKIFVSLSRYPFFFCITEDVCLTPSRPPTHPPKNKAFYILFSSSAEYPCLYACSCYAIPISLLFCRFSVSTASVSEMWPSGLRGVRSRFHTPPSTNTWRHSQWRKNANIFYWLPIWSCVSNSFACKRRSQSELTQLCV